MKKAFFTRVLALSAGALLSACAAENGNEIGSTVKGERIAVLEPGRALDAEKESAAVSLPEKIINLSWPQAGYDPLHAIPNVEASPQPEEIWTSSIGEGSSSNFKLLARPVAAKGAVYTMDAEGAIRAFDIQSGDILWEAETTPPDNDEPAMGGGLAVDGPTLYATTGFGEVHALDAKTGAVKWMRPLLKPLRAAPTVADERVYVVSIDNELTALDASSGDVLWRQSGISESAALMGAASPAVEGDMVVAAYNSGELYALRVQNGRVLWTYSLAAVAQMGAMPAIADIRGLPVIDRGRVFAISNSGRIAAIDQRTGDRIWEADIGGINTPVVAAEAVFVYGNDGNLVALSRDSGRALWVQPLAKHEDPEDKESDPVVWTGPILAGGKLWMVNSSGAMQAFSPENGLPYDSIDIGKAMYIAPIVVDRTYFVVTDSGKLVALR